jgi:hypothetical protein
MRRHGASAPTAEKRGPSRQLLVTIACTGVAGAIWLGINAMQGKVN